MKGFLSKLWKGVALFLICVMVGVNIMPYLRFENNADAKKTQHIDLQESTAASGSSNKGTLANPFTILEIVPHHDMSQMIWLSDETMPKLEGVKIRDYKQECGQSTFATGLSGMCAMDDDTRGENADFDGKTPLVDRASFNTTALSQSIITFNKKQKTTTNGQQYYGNSDFIQILKMFGYTGLTYINEGNITPEGRAKAIKILDDFHTMEDQNPEDQDPDNQDPDNQAQLLQFDETKTTFYKSTVEKIHNNEIFKRLIIGKETEVVKEEWARTKLMQEGIMNPNPSEINAKILTFSRTADSALYNSIKEQSITKEKILNECKGFHIRVIVATPDEVNRSVANPSVAVNTVAVFPEKEVDGNYQTYSANSGKSLIDMADLVFMLNDYTNIESGLMYDYFTKDARRDTTTKEAILKKQGTSTYDYGQTVGNHYQYDLSGKASYQMLTRMVGGVDGSQKRLPVIINKRSFENVGGGDLFNSKNNTHNISRIMLLEMLYDFDVTGFNAASFLGRFSYQTGAGYNGADSPASDNAYIFKFNDDAGTTHTEWGGGNFRDVYNNPTNGSYCLAYNNTVYVNTSGILNKSVFVYNTVEAFNNTILKNDYSNTNDVFKHAVDYIANNQIVSQGYDNTGKLSPADIIRAIVDHTGSAPTLPMSTLRVLEIQPCASFEKEEALNSMDRKAQLEEMYRKLLPNFVGSIKIDQMSSIELIGSTVDVIENYDLIYFGLRTGKMNRNSSGVTVYNDTSLNGKIYLHTGDVVNFARSNYFNHSNQDKKRMFRGVLSLTTEGKISNNVNDDGRDAADVYRYSGNDLSKLVEKKLEDFVKSGHCVVFDRNFFQLDATGNPEVNKGNEYYIDNTSNMYDFVQFCTKGNSTTGAFEYVGSRVFGVDTNTFSIEIGSNLETALAYAPYVEVKMLNSEPDYMNGQSYAGYGINGSAGLRIVTNTSRDFSFTFEIYSANTSGNFTAEIYVDKYHDGSFSKDADFAGERHGIHAGAATTMTIPLTEDFIGMIPWKLLVYEETTDTELSGLRRSSAYGYAAVRREGDETENINVLQIKSSRTNGTVDLLSNPQFLKYSDANALGSAVGYSLSFEAVRIDDLVTDPEFFGNVANEQELIDDQSKNAFLKRENNKLKYNMIVLGFDDGYGFGSNLRLNYEKQKIIFTAIDQYINQGYAVLLSHDMLSFYNNSSTTVMNNEGGYYTGYYKNYRLRERLAADRYGVYLSEDDRVAKKKDVPYRAGSASAENPDGVPIKNRDDWYDFGRPNSQQPALLYNNTQMQGWSNGVLDSFSRTPQKKSSSYNGNFPFAQSGQDGNTTNIVQTNKGQVTLFPYVIDEEYDSTVFNVASTHCQYYQLDMEREDLVVWYTLAGNYYTHNGPDPRNNYYIYNTENITYTGMGHSGGVSDREVKLFINTMIASYRAAMEAPYSIVRNDGAATSSSGSNTQYLYVDYDTFSDIVGSATIISADLGKDPETGEDCIKVLYSVIDKNMLYNKKAYVSPVVFSHSTKGKVTRNGNAYSSNGIPIYPTTYNSIDNYKNAELTQDNAISLSTTGRTNVYLVNSDGSIGNQISYEDVTIGSSTSKAIPVEHDVQVKNSTKVYCTFVPLKYFKEEGTDYNDIYVGLSCMILYGQDSDRQVLYGDGNIVNISKRELFDLR